MNRPRPTPPSPRALAGSVVGGRASWSQNRAVTLELAIGAHTLRPAIVEDRAAPSEWVAVPSRPTHRGSSLEEMGRVPPFEGRSLNAPFSAIERPPARRLER